LALWDAVRRSIDLFPRPEEWNLLTERAESVDFSWVESAKAFGVLYANLLRLRPANTVAAF
jgi:glycogen synthase